MKEVRYEMKQVRHEMNEGFLKMNNNFNKILEINNLQNKIHEVHGKPQDTMTGFLFCGAMLVCLLNFIFLTLVLIFYY
jgi:hypothetical protein